jgi:hypothetical protein
MINELESIEKYKAGTLRGQAVLDLFSLLLRTGRVWDLGFGKFAGALINRGLLTPGGDIIKGI